MPKRISKPKTRKRNATEKLDVNQIAFRTVQQSIANLDASPTSMTKSQISQLMAEMGRRGGRIGGKKRLETMTPEARKAAAQKAAKARWDAKT